MPKILTCKVCLRDFDRAEYDVGHEICSIACKFWHGVPDENETCWLWGFKKDNRGYGILRWKGHEYLAHRIGYAEFYGLEEHPTERLYNICGKNNCVRGDHWTFDSSYRIKRYT